MNKSTIQADLDDAWEVLAEPLQTVMRRHGVEDSYEKLKQLTRGNKISKSSLTKFITELSLGEEIKKQLLDLSPDSYVGNAAQQALEIVAKTRN